MILKPNPEKAEEIPGQIILFQKFTTDIAVLSTRKAKVLRSLRQCAPLQPKIFLCMSLITFMYA
jgi:hypothetical protein